MLVLARKRNEAIVIGDSIRITVIEIRGGKVRLGIEAPKNVLVSRPVLTDKKRTPAKIGSFLRPNGAESGFYR